jgi:hypothetical protein
VSEHTGVFVPTKPYEGSAQDGPFSRFEPGTRILPAGFQVSDGYLPLPQDLVFEKDTAVQLRDGTTIYTDIFRPPGDGPFPVLVAWSPYGKTTGTAPRYTMLRDFVGVEKSKLSGLMKWEAPDPAFWCTQGYAVCNPDARGAFNSEGDIQFFGEQEGRDTHDFIEWAAAQPWSSGKVGMAGNSWLAVSQWFAAAEQPPHLAAIAPWEGFSDVYRDFIAPGGIPDPGFPRGIQAELHGSNRVEDLGLALEHNPLFDDYWAAKAARLDRVNIPVYLAATYTNTVHTAGTFRAWREVASGQKWFRIHNRVEWNDFYDETTSRDLLRFFDRFLKGIDNGWEQTPPVRYSVLDLEGGDIVNRPAPYFPPPGVTSTPLYLDSATSSLTAGLPGTEAAAEYDAEEGRTEFTVVFDEQTEIIGYPEIKLWVAADGYDDMDLFVFLQKLDRDGNHLAPQNSGINHPRVEEVARTTATVLKYKAVPGRMRVSLRRPDPDLSAPGLPVQSCRAAEKLQPGEVVPVEIPLLPVGLLMYPGEALRVIVTGTNIIGTQMPFAAPTKPDNHGRHIVHTGGRYDSRLVLPILKGGAE